MKNFFKSLAICALAALTFASCQKENAGGNMDDQSSVVSINLTSPLMGTKAFADGNTVNVVHVHVYKVGANNSGLTYIAPGTSPDVTPSQDVEMRGGRATYSTRLVTGQTYTFVFWAEKKDNGHYAYDPATQTIAVNYTNAAGNDETRDAFYAVLKNVQITGAYSQSVELKRPFAQVNFGVTDEDKDAAEDAGFIVSKAAVKCTNVADRLNLLTGTASGSVPNVTATFALTDLPSQTLSAANKTYNYVAMNYVLVGKDASLSDITLTLEANDPVSATPEYTYHNIPLQGNYRTNIVGDLFTSPASINITVDSDFEGDNNKCIPNVSSIQAANEALANGATNINITNITASEARETTLQMPATLESINISIERIESTANLKIEKPDNGSHPASVAVSIPSSASVNQLTINLPQSHVEINGASYTSINATTSNNTLVIGKNVTVETLTIEAGAVEIYGEVGTLTKGTNAGDVKVWAVADVENWNKAYNAGANKIELKANIDAIEKTNLDVPKNGTVDGKGNTLSGNVCLSVNAVGGTIKNMNFKDIHNNENELSAVYASGLTGKLEISGCTFDTFDWDAIQTTPKAGAKLEITGNTFKYTGTPSGNNRRYVHIQSSFNTDFSAKVTDNTFLNNDQLLMSAMEVYYFSDDNKINLNGNYFDSPAKVCVLARGWEVATDVLKNMKIKTLEGEEVKLAAYIDINGDQRIFTSFNDALSVVDNHQSIYLLNDNTLSSETAISEGTLTINLNNNKLTVKEDLMTTGTSKLTILNGELECIDNSQDGTHPNIRSVGNSTMEIDNVRLVSSGSAVYVGNECNFTIKNSELVSQVYGISTNASNANQNPTINVENCQLTGGDPILVNIPCALTVKQSRIQGMMHGVIVRGGTALFKECAIILNYDGTDANAMAHYFDNIIWGSGNMINLAALAIGNKGNEGSTAYQYPTNVTLEKTNVIVEGDNKEYFPALYAYANSGAGLGVTLTYDSETTFTGGLGAVYGSNNIVVTQK